MPAPGVAHYRPMHITFGAMRRCYHTFLKVVVLICLPCLAVAQPAVDEITGLWQGTISTGEKDLPYEILIAEKDGRLSGYAHTTFLVNGKEIISVKKIEVKFQNQSVIIEDDDLVFENFDANAPKKIRQTNILFYKQENNQEILTGTFETRVSRTMRPAKGGIYLQKKYTEEDTRIVAKLKDLKLEDTYALSLTPPASLAKTESRQLSLPAIPVAEPAADTTKKILSDPFIAKVAPAPKQDSMVVTVTVITEPEVVAAPELPVLRRQAFTAMAPLKNRAAFIPSGIRPQRKMDDRAIAFLRYRVTQALPAPVVASTVPAASTTTTPAIVKNTDTPPAAPSPTSSRPAVAPIITRTNVAVAPVVDLSKRIIETIDELTIAADSLTFSLYDNGTIDGDSVSIILNGKTIVSKQMLSTVPITKTVYLTPDLGDTIQLVMYAENLGTIAPNTGLLVLLYDNQRREIRFSGDLNKNAAITLRRRRR